MHSLNYQWQKRMFTKQDLILVVQRRLQAQSDYNSIWNLYLKDLDQISDSCFNPIIYKRSPTLKKRLIYTMSKKKGDAQNKLKEYNLHQPFLFCLGITQLLLLQ